jgi:hypothetical protein
MNSESTSAVMRRAIVLVAALATGTANGAPPVLAPLPNAHAHNDYEHSRPLFDALDQGFCSVEADVFSVDGSLLVGHDRGALKPERTLESLYLAPLAKRVRQNDGHVYPHGIRFFLLVDIKDDPERTYRDLRKLLAKYADMLTNVEAGKLQGGAVTVVLTGNRPRIDSDDSSVRYVALDGRVSDLNIRAPSHLMPMISDDWTKRFHWNGNGPMPEKERATLRGIVNKAHASHRVVRFWKTQENETVWRELCAAGVDLINTDELDRLARFLRTPNDNSTDSAK